MIKVKFYNLLIYIILIIIAYILGSIRFKDEYHGTSSKPSNFLRTHGYINAWFDKHSVRK